MSTNALGLFGAPSSALEAAGALKGAGFDSPTVLSPIPIHGIEKVLGKKKSIIKRCTFFGAIFGGIAGFALAAGTAVMYIHPTGGRAIIAIPPFLIITYELTILCGILATVAGFVLSARLPALKNRVYVPEVAVDKFAVSVMCEDPEQLRCAREILQNTGAEEIREVEGAQ